MKRNGEKIYPNLELEIFKRGIKKSSIAETADLNANRLADRLNGKIDFRLEEAIVIWKTFFADIPIDELFKRKE